MTFERFFGLSPDREGNEHQDKNLYEDDPERDKLIQSDIQRNKPKKKLEISPKQRKTNQDGIDALRSILEKSNGPTKKKK